MSSNKIYLAVEFTVLFIFLPIIPFLELFPLPKIPALIAMTLFCLFVLLADKSFNKKDLWNAKVFKKHVKKILLRFIPAAAGLVIITLIIQPELLFIFPRERIFIWTMVMILYPILSAYPQELVYRTFMFHRYRNLFTSEKVKIVISSLAFSFLHIIFDNYIAVILSLIGGFLFTITYRKSNSLFTAAFEHAIYGCFVFTVGLGNYFYEGRPS